MQPAGQTAPSPDEHANVAMTSTAAKNRNAGARPHLGRAPDPSRCHHAASDAEWQPDRQHHTNRRGGVSNATVAARPGDSRSPGQVDNLGAGSVVLHPPDAATDARLRLRPSDVATTSPFLAFSLNLYSPAASFVISNVAAVIWPLLSLRWRQRDTATQGGVRRRAVPRRRQRATDCWCDGLAASPRVAVWSTIRRGAAERQPQGPAEMCGRPFAFRRFAQHLRPAAC